MTPAPGAASVGVPILEVEGLTAGYGGRPVVHDVDLTVGRGEVVVVLGGNGAGKTTTLAAILGLVPPIRASVRYAGRLWRTNRPWSASAAGISLIPAERATFAGLSVRENLDLGAYASGRADSERRRERVLDLFPRLGERLDQRAGTMSGGEQRMLSLAVALMAGPQLLMLDEPSLGLAPAVVQQIMAAIRELVQNDGLSVLMVEQNVGQALPVAERVYVMRSGRILMEEPAATTLARDQWWDLF